ncbi:BEL1-like homeodomain protein 9 [Vigna unguiculata]|uniref:Pre-B-cell leukemia transcription factor n=1 Tax=Vigna unguiculata TaxID=3917 RepID=A0A4D6N6C2_VIGUN|nr:BEL1-like homeodomain protein 9 [Vigna unguiculata]XP_027926870.1 BEL1-like homeodomain protein 9 [Vigna unguiculata]XP_027926871.1 BEL1-like homeodomain protein 9 [Vigna unguiculata]QCE09363.1 pre-B-cell leukemia transcription factor [Vigna unguiculata]
MSSLRPESHVAQQIRREKLRIQNSSQPLHEFPNNLEPLSLHPGFNNFDLLHVRNVRNANMLDEQVVYPPEMPNFSTSLNPLSAPKNALEYHQEIDAAEASNRLMMNQYGSFSHSMPATHSSHKEQCELRNLGNWRNSAPQQGSDWFVNYPSNANSFLSSELNNVSSYNELMDVQCSNASDEISGRQIQKQLGGLHNPPPPSPLYQNALQDIVKSASIGAHTRQDMTSLMQQNDHSIWVGNGSEVELQQQSYDNQPNPLRFGWTNRAIDNIPSDSLPQSLSLSLSSNAQPKPSVSQHEQGSTSDDPRCLKNMKPSIVSRDSAKSLQDTVGMPSKSTMSYRSVGPLGPFTGYATILKSSRFLKSVQQLLDEIFCVSGAKFAKSYDVSERVSPEISASTSADTVTVNETGVTAKGSNSGSSSTMLYNVSKENSADLGVGSSFGLSSRPDYQQKKAKLLYMQEEVTRQCKQYHLQMQMVISSFESVAGLGSATPYISMALKSVSKHFRCLKNSISDQLKLMSEALGEDVSKPSCSSGSKADTTMARIRCSMDQSFLKNKSGRGGTTDLLDPQQHVWRPQRGLPERAVAILKAWLFEHFLHPYPTDTDKHMLASQTGLSRNQVSNWFINARVRVWKPMVEEIHMLETKATGTREKSGKHDQGTSSGPEGGDTSQTRVDKPLSNIGMNSIPENRFEGMEMESSNAEERGLNEEQWSQEKRSKLECQMTSNNMDGTLMGFVPYRRGGLEVGGLGSVSLTLGLRHGVEGVQHQQQLQEEQLRHHHLGGHMIRDYVG